MIKRLKKFMILPTILILSCSTSYHKYLAKDVNPNSKIAVIICETQLSAEHALFADTLNNSFEAGTRLNVVPQYKVKSVLGDYPIRIRGPFSILGLDFVKAERRLDLDTLSVMAKKLNVDYLYAIWIAQAVEVNIRPKVIRYTYVGELIEFPSRRVIADVSNIMYGEDGRDVFRTSCGYQSELIVKDIIDNTGIGKI